MPRINFLLICDKAELIGEKLNIEGVFNAIQAKGFPARHESLTVVINFEIEKAVGKSGRESFQIKYNDEILTQDGVDLDIKNKNQQIIHNIKNLVLPAAGKYTVEIYLDKKCIGSTYFIANQI